MPELPIKEGRLSDLHLPEIKREDIVRSLSEIRLPDIDLTRLERPKFDLPDAVSKFEWPTIDLPSVDVGKAVAGAVAAVKIGRRAPRPRWPLAVGGLLVAGVAAWTILTNETVRAWLTNVARTLRERLAARRSDEHDRLEIDRDHPIAFDAAQTAPIAAPAFTDSIPIDATGYPDGLGSKNGDGTRAPEEAGSPT